MSDIFLLRNDVVPSIYATTLSLLSVVAQRPGPVVSDSNAALHAVRLAKDPLDTSIVSGSDWRVRSSDQTLAWIKTATHQARRVASVCTGAFLLAEAGLLNGRRATTHWEAAADLARWFPKVRVEACGARRRYETPLNPLERPRLTLTIGRVSP